MSQRSSHNHLSFVAPGLALLLCAHASFAAVVPAETAVSARQFTNPALEFETHIITATQSGRAGDLDALLVPADLAYVDSATGRFATLIPTQPLIPGHGVGNELTWGDLARRAPTDDDDLAAAAGHAFRQYLTDHSTELRLSPSEFGELKVTVVDDTILLSVPRQVGGVPVRDSYITATLNQGNLILTGATRWADVTVSARPAIDETAARRSLNTILGGLPVNGRWGDTELAFVPIAQGDRLAYRLVYSLKPSFDDELGNFEGLVDAHTGELLSFLDTNSYATRHVIGGVYPESYDGDGPDGTEQLGWPMPYADLGPVFSDSGGNFPREYTGEAVTTLAGLYVTINDTCGAVEASSFGTNDIDFGGSDGTDCTTPPGGSPGNTHASRTAFYEVNRVFEWARTRLPNNDWLSDANLDANVNINSSCNAFYGPDDSINMYTSGAGCGNTGEVAGVLDHEWGHGMDFRDGTGFSNPREGIPDVYAALRLDRSCIGRGFFQSRNCSGYGDPCLDCSGIRDIDWAMRESGEPHDVAWSNANCGGADHCEGAVMAEAVWDLKARDIPGEFGFDNNTSLELATRLTMLGATNVTTWFTTNADGEDGCGAGAGYMNYIAADDIDGDLTNGTPHMTAIFAAFDRHGIACSNPGVQNRGCEDAPTQAPNVTATGGDSAVRLSWDAVPGADNYHVYRTEGVRRCNKGKIYLGRATGTNFTDTGLLNGLEYYYTVHAKIAGGRSCLGPMSACTAVTPN